MKIAVRYQRRNRPTSKPHTLIVEVNEGVRKDEDAIHDFCHDHISEEVLGEDPKWIRLEGVVHLQPLDTFLKQ